MLIRDWLPRPRQVVVLFLAVAVVSTAALGWLTWQLLDQDDELEVARRRGELEQAADRMATTLVDALAGLETLATADAAGAAAVPPDVTIVTIAPGGTNIRSGLLSFVPTRAPLPEAPEGMLAAANRAAEIEGDTAVARRLYAALAAGPGTPLRAKALVRLAALERRAGDPAAALRAYAALDVIDDAGVGGLPVSLIAQVGRAAALERAERIDELRAHARTFIDDLHRGRWALLAPEFEFYREEGARWLGTTTDTGMDTDQRRDVLIRSEAADWLWRNAASNPRHGRQLVALQSGAALVLWRSEDSNVSAVLCGSLLLNALVRAHTPEGFDAVALDAFGQRAGGASPAAGQATMRPAGTDGLPFTLRVSGQAPGSAARRPLLALILGATLVFVASGWYLILRAIFREARVARLQSEFVAAVSHEFRSPLTSIGHVAELLAEDRLPTDDLRRQSYQALVRDADRLRRLVENLLDFGRFDTGAATYRFERTDVARLVETVVGDFRQRVTGAGWQNRARQSAGTCRCGGRPRGVLARALEPARQRREVLAGDPARLGGGGACGRDRQHPGSRPRYRHSRERTGDRVPAVRTRDGHATAGDRRHGYRPGHGAPDCPGAWRRCHGHERARRGLGVHAGAETGGGNGMIRVLIVEDEPTIAFALEADLTTEGYTTTVVRDGREVTAAVDRERPDLILLDIMLPGRDGFEVCRDLRRSGVTTPIIVLTARTHDAEKVMGLELGADDYVTKPYNPRELRARVKAVLRRTNGAGRDEGAPGSGEAATFGDVEADFERGEVRRAGRRVDLSALEYKLLQAFVRNRGRLLSREQLLDQAWGHGVVLNDRVVDNHIVGLRRKLEDDPAKPRFFLNVRGLGYRFDA